MSTVGLNPTAPVARDQVDLIEVNHYHDEHGKLVFDQIIFYDWSPHDSRYHVRAWRLLKRPAQLPRRNWRDGGFTAVWRDGEVLRMVRAKAVRETWTQHDPELVERNYLPKDQRRELRSLAIKVGEKTRR